MTMRRGNRGRKGGTTMIMGLNMKIGMVTTQGDGER
jgi:hypothetical protein